MDCGFPALGETLRAQISRLPDLPKPQQLDSDMAQLRVNRLHYEELLNKLSQSTLGKQDDGKPLTAEQSRILAAQLRTQRNCLTHCCRAMTPRYWNSPS